MLIGTSASGVVNDVQATPIASHMPGVEIHAQLIDQILQGVYLTRPDWATGAELIFAMVVSLVLIVALPRIGALASALVGVLGDHRRRRRIVVGVSRLPAAARPGVSDDGRRAGLFHCLGLGLSAHRDAPPRSARHVLAVHVAALRRRAGEEPGKAGARRRGAKSDGDVLRYPRVHDLVGGADPARADPSDEQLYLADDRRHRRLWRHDRQVYRRLHHGVLERAARRPRPRQACGRGGARHPPQAGRAEPQAEARGRGSGQAVSRAARRHRPQHRRMRRRQFRLRAALQLFAARRPGEPRLAARRACASSTRSIWSSARRPRNCSTIPASSSSTSSRSRAKATRSRFSPCRPRTTRRPTGACMPS